MRVATYRAPNFVFTEHEFELPLDHAQPGGPTITVFAREVVTPAHEHDDRPWLVFLQGGPGSESPRLLKLVDETWWERALQDYRLLLLDQRGTGPLDSGRRRSPEMSAQGAGRVPDPLPRRLDRPRRRGDPHGARHREAGACSARASAASASSTTSRRRRRAWPRRSSPAACRRSSGTPTTSTARRTSGRAPRTTPTTSAIPRIESACVSIVERLETEDVRLPSGDRLTGRRFRQVGHVLGMSDGAETVHYIVELPFGSPAFLHDVEVLQSFPRNPLYAVIHEACYASGVATRWSADRVFPDERAGRSDLPHRRAHLSVDVRGVRRARAAGRGGADPGRARVAGAVRRRTPRATTRSRPRPRSTPRTCTSRASSRRRRPPPSAASVPG